MKIDKKFLKNGHSCTTEVKTETDSIAVSQSYDLVDSYIPFISDTGALAPASCWFTFLLNATSFSFILVITIRFLEVREHLKHDQLKIKVTNIVSFVFGLVGTVGLCIVAAFQETGIPALHVIGAYMGFLGKCFLGFNSNNNNPLWNLELPPPTRGRI